MGWVECILLEHCLHLRKLCCPPVLPYKESFVTKTKPDVCLFHKNMPKVADAHTLLRCIT